MATDKQAGLLYEAWADLDRVTSGLDPSTATRSLEQGSSIAWAVAHVTSHLDNWINVRFAEWPPNPVTGEERFRLHGKAVLQKEWEPILTSVHEVRRRVRRYLDSSPSMDTPVPYNGSIDDLRQTGITLRYAILRMVAHHYFHIGEISTKRDRLGHSVGDYPGTLFECIVDNPTSGNRS